MKNIVMLAGFALATVCAASASAQGAVVISDFGCGLLNGSGGGVFTVDSHVTITPSASGNRMLRCRASVPPSPTGRSVHWNHVNTGLFCNASGVLTVDWSEVISRSGEATLTCHVKP